MTGRRSSLRPDSFTRLVWPARSSCCSSQSRPWRIAADGRAQASNDVVQPFSLRNLGFQVRYRYVLAPLSNLYVVYGRGGFGYDGYAAGAFEQFGDAFSLRDDEQLLVKLAYRFEL